MEQVEQTERTVTLEAPIPVMPEGGGMEISLPEWVLVVLVEAVVEITMHLVEVAAIQVEEVRVAAVFPVVVVVPTTRAPVRLVKQE